jgi:hypothetical protein
LSEVVVIRKLMSLTRAEFVATLAILTGETTGMAHAHIALDPGSVDISFAEEPPATLGNLLSLPRATVTLSFADVPAAAREHYLARFERTFQRGGG